MLSLKDFPSLRRMSSLGKCLPLACTRNWPILFAKFNLTTRKNLGRIFCDKSAPFHEKRGSFFNLGPNYDTLNIKVSGKWAGWDFQISRTEDRGRMALVPTCGFSLLRKFTRIFDRTIERFSLLNSYRSIFQNNLNTFIIQENAYL